MLQVIAVDPDRPETAVVERAVSLLRAGELVIYPTDTLYALGGRALEPEAAEKVRTAKGREERKPLPLVAADGGQARGLCAAWPVAADRLATRFWPGPLTLVLAARPEIPAEVTAGTGTVAVRVPGSALARMLCEAAGSALVSTSANRSGAPAPRTCTEAVTGVGAFAALALDGGPGHPRSSTIVDLSGNVPRLLREGPVPWADVLEVLG
jgi:L-threonylcarbamoyladenylate synthase